LFNDFLAAQGEESPEEAEPVSVASNFKGKPRTPGDTTVSSTDCSRTSHQSNWTIGLAETNVEAKIPEEMHRHYAPQSNPPTGSDIPSTGTWAQVGKTHIPTTTPSPQQ
jgi:hypothetical protein